GGKVERNNPDGGAGIGGLRAALTETDACRPTSVWTHQTRALIGVDQPVAPPPDASKPCACPFDRRRGEDTSGGRCAGPSVEPPCRRARIEPASWPEVLAEVVQHVDEGVAHLARCPDHASVVPAVPHLSASPEDPIHGLRHADGEAAHTTLEIRRPVRLYHQVQMIGLDADMERPVNVATCGCARKEGKSSSRAVDVYDDGSL